MKFLLSSARVHLPVLLLFGLVASAASAQGTPIANASADLGFQLPSTAGTLNYSLTGSESISTGFSGYNGTLSSTNISGNLGYLSNSQKHPFSAIYSGGYQFSTSNQPSAPFQDLALSQVVHGKKWSFTLADSLYYLPDSPLGGLSGIPGVGDLGVDPVLTGGQGVITPYETRIDNLVSGTLARTVTAKTSVSGTGGYEITRFLGSSTGIDQNTVLASGSISHRPNPRNSFSGSYNYANFVFIGTTYAMTSQSGTLEYNRQFSRRMYFDVYGGPQYVSGTVLSQASTNVTGGATLGLNEPLTRYSLSYSRGVSAGSGVIEGSRNDTVGLYVHHAFGREWGTSAFLSFGRSATLPNFVLPPFSANTFVAGVQATRKLSKDFFAFGSYSIQQQSSTGTLLLVPQVYNGVSQTIGFGITYSPASISVR